MMSSSRNTAIPGLAPPPVLIFFHIPKTGGMTMEKVIERCLRDEQFNAYLKMPDTALLVRSAAKVAEKVISCRSKGSMRFVAWSARILPSMSLLFSTNHRCFLRMRHPVDRVVSNFFHNRVMSHLPCYPFIKDLTLEQYLGSGIGLDQDNHLGACLAAVLNSTGLGTLKAAQSRSAPSSGAILKWPSATLRNASSSRLRSKNTPPSFGS
jgi:hypothetical protein